MPVGDIFSATFHYEGPSREASSRLFFRRTTLEATAQQGNLELVTAIRADLIPLMLDCMSDQWSIPAITARKHYANEEAKWVASTTPSVGTIASPALPGNNAVNVGLIQSLNPQKQNGRFYLPGVPEDQTTVSILNAAYTTGPLAAFVARLLLPFEDVSNPGEFECGVISQKILDAAPPAKDWAGAFAPLTSVTTPPQIAIMRRRQTRVIGVAP